MKNLPKKDTIIKTGVVNFYDSFGELQLSVKYKSRPHRDKIIKKNTRRYGKVSIGIIPDMVSNL